MNCMFNCYYLHKKEISFYLFECDSIAWNAAKNTELHGLLSDNYDGW